jgi:hypothetical protein
MKEQILFILPGPPSTLPKLYKIQQQKHLPKLQKHLPKLQDPTTYLIL